MITAGGATSFINLALHLAERLFRTLARRFRSATGNSPREYAQRVKVEVAKRSLEAGARVSSVAQAIGYEDVAAFRRLFNRETGMTPLDYRARYGPKAPPSTVLTSASRR